MQWLQIKPKDNLGICLPKPVFSHGQRYVALSRGGLLHRTIVLLIDVNDTQGIIDDSYVVLLIDVNDTQGIIDNNHVVLLIDVNDTQGIIDNNYGKYTTNVVFTEFLIR